MSLFRYTDLSWFICDLLLILVILILLFDVALFDIVVYMLLLEHATDWLTATDSDISSDSHMKDNFLKKLFSVIYIISMMFNYSQVKIFVLIFDSFSHLNTN